MRQVVSQNSTDNPLSTDRRTSRLNGPIGARLWARRKHVKELAAVHGLSNVRVFGSVARGEETEDSDLDLLVDVGPGVGLIGLARAQQRLEELLGARVDLVPASDLKPGVAGSVLTDADAALSRFDRQRLEDILAAIDTIRSHLDRGDLSDGLIFDAVRVRLIEIVKRQRPYLQIWSQPNPRYRGTKWAKCASGSLVATSTLSHAIVAATVEGDLPELESAVGRLSERLGEG